MIIKYFKKHTLFFATFKVRLTSLYVHQLFTTKVLKKPQK